MRMIVAAMVLAGVLFAIAPAAAFDSAKGVELEVGAGMTLFPIHGADIGPIVGASIYTIPENPLGLLEGSKLFADVGQLSGVAFLGAAVSTNVRGVRIGAALWRSGHIEGTIYLRYGQPFNLSW